MNVLFVSAGFLPQSRGGTEVHAYHLARELRSRGHGVSVFCREGDAARRDYAIRDYEFDEVGVTAVNYNFQDADRFEMIHRNARIEDAFVRELERRRPDLVHVHHLTCLSTGILDRVAERGLPLAMTLHDYWMACPRGQRIRDDLDLCEALDRARCEPCLKRLWPHFDIDAARLSRLDHELTARLNRCDVLISPSRFHREKMLEMGLDAARSIAIPHGLPAEVSARPRRRDAIRTIGYIGSVIPSKGAHVLIEAFNKVDRPGLKLRIHGEAPSFHGDSGYLDRLRRLADERLDITFEGAYEPESVGRILEEIDLLVVPSLWWESFCLTVREAFLAGVPVLASRTGGITEAFEDGRGGRLFEPGSVADLREKLQELLDEPAKYRGLAATIPKVRSIASCADETIATYRDISERKAAEEKTRAGGVSPHATVFIPTWNGGPLFERVLEKILAQKTSFPFEVLVIDSGSRDGTLDVVRRHPDVRLIEIPNSEFNHGLTRNRAVAEARGSIVALLTQDAEPLDEHWLERLVANFSDPRVAGAYCHQLPRPDCNPFQRDRLRGWTKEAGAPVVKELDGRRFEDMHPFERYRLIAFDDVASCVRKEVMQAIPFEKRQFGEDIAWARQAILGGWRIVNDPGAVVIHSHDSPILYEFRRVYLDHQNIHDLVGLHTLPKWWMVPLFSVKALFHLLGVVWRDDRGTGYRLWWSLKTPLYAFTQNLAQYLGAKSVRWKREARFGWFDRRMRRGI